MRNVRVLILVLSLLAAACSVSQAATINVPGDATGIQAAIDGANDSDTVLVAEGHYFERIDFRGKRILLTSEFVTDGDSLHILNTIIDADTSVLGLADTGSVVVFHNSEDSATVLQGFTIQNGIGTSPPPPHEIYRRGGGIHCDSSSPTIRHCLIRQNAAAGSGGGLICQSGSEPIVSNCVFEGNSTGIIGSGGGVQCVRSSAVFERCSFRDNWASPSGMSGGVDCFICAPTFNHCLFSKNQGGIAGGALICYDAPASFLGCLFADNSALYAGGIFCYGAAPSFTNCTVVGNAATSGNGGGFYLELSSPALENCIIAFNRQGEAMTCLYESAPTLACCDIYGNAGGDWTGPISDQAGVNGNLCLDPLFCDIAGSDFQIDGSSPCAATNNDCGTLIGALDVGCNGAFNTAIVPTAIHAFEANAVGSTPAVAIYLGSFADSLSVSDIDLSSIRVNEVLVPSEITVLSAYPGFVGEVIEMELPLDDFVHSYGLLWDTTVQVYSVSGLFNDESGFAVNGAVITIGRISGDVNEDGVVDISDLVELVGFMFQGKPQPPMLEAADLDRNGLVDIADLIDLVRRMFGGSIGPLLPRRW